MLKISEDAYANGDGTSDAAGDATFTVAIDGKQQGGTFTAVASHAAGADQTFSFNGYFGTSKCEARGQLPVYCGAVSCETR